MVTNACREQRRERARYVRTTREVVARGHTWATAPDAARFSGRDWQCSPIVSVDAQLRAWMVPVALFVRTSTFSDVVPVLLRTSVRHFSELAGPLKHGFFFIPSTSQKLFPPTSQKHFSASKRILVSFSFVGADFFGIDAMLLLHVGLRCIDQVQRESIVRGRSCTTAVTHEERVQWKSDARAFLLACKQQDMVEADRVKVQLPQKIDRLSAFYATHTSAQAMTASPSSTEHS